ncbi:peptidoglycan bridge formation glycyltransferase FemA/FemB family protein [Streptomyces camelliae]|uniref:Peptidoglycan bridge formation glycyltransferase FemA/FemB family protein n=1 Tax=Streptomyces camelliae TaxID=3004093 RepID=A0ABY7NX47_9ACTN|nr:peptidoglycan bridge formation glycyltransferase FemA/FemB family protein [Streptomyces sp. HUAS 2-6]WBO61900.1 peptidoglycan bridge formation glycyltransferase FemA/FemB family protein [Streptomyces sp. HUAS 2-6]
MAPQHQEGREGRRQGRPRRLRRPARLLRALRRDRRAGPFHPLCDAHELGVGIYDFRGITDTLEEDNLLGLLRFKVGTGGQAVEHIGEWDYPLNKMLHKALGLYVSRR